MCMGVGGGGGGVGVERLLDGCTAPCTVAMDTFG